MESKHLGVIFDWDGVVLDSSRFHEESWSLLASDRSLPLPDGHFHRGFGMRNESIIPEILGWSHNPEEIQELAFAKETLYRKLLSHTGIDPLPGVLKLLIELKSREIPTAVGSSTPRENLELAIQLLGLEEYFQATVCGDDVTRGKPFPDVFELAAQKIGCDASRCLVIEDAPVGIEAARNAQMKCVAVTTTNPAQTLAFADLVVNSLQELNAEQLIKLVGNE
jgi:HAD superfamily hydrolase (TIGR01509 family)